MHEKAYKAILSAQNGMNVYRGCTHGCIYCDSRSACYQMQHAFEDIEVKCNAPELLRDALRRKRRKCMIGTGSMCDPYLQCEATLEVTRRCLEIIAAEGFGATLLTKSAMILRDLDLLEQINRQSKCVVQMTLTTFDEATCRLVEPNVSTTRERLEVLRTLQAHGIPTVVWLSPILPWINDTPENIISLLHACRDAGVRGIIHFGMGVTLREGNRAYFYRQLDLHFPGLKERYIRRFGNAYVCNSEQAPMLEQLFAETCAACGLESDSQKLFAYLHAFPDREAEGQLSLFSM